MASAHDGRSLTESETFRPSAHTLRLGQRVKRARAPMRLLVESVIGVWNPDGLTPTGLPAELGRGWQPTLQTDVTSEQL